MQWDLRGSQGGDGDSDGDGDASSVGDDASDASSGEDAIIFVDDMTRDGLVREKRLGLHVLKPDDGVSGNRDSTIAAVRDALGMVPPSVTEEARTCWRVESESCLHFLAFEER